MNTLHSLAMTGAIRTENVFDTGTDLLVDIKKMAIVAIVVVAICFVVAKFVQSRGSVGSIIGIVAIGAIATWAATHMDDLAGDVGDTLNGSSVHQIVRHAAPPADPTTR